MAKNEISPAGRGEGRSFKIRHVQAVAGAGELGQFAVPEQVGFAEEQERMNCAKQAALNFIDVIEKDIKGHLELLETLKSRDLRVESAPKTAVEKPKPYDWQNDSGVGTVSDFVVPSTPVQPAKQSAGDIASEISENLEKLVGSDPDVAPSAPAAPARPSHPESATIKFSDLKFGKNYDPTSV